MNFQVGDRVTIRKDSEYFRNQGGHGTGTIMDDENFDAFHYTVEFDDNYTNSYRVDDLELVSINYKMGGK